MLPKGDPETGRQRCGGHRDSGAPEPRPGRAPPPRPPPGPTPCPPPVGWDLGGRGEGDHEEARPLSTVPHLPALRRKGQASMERLCVPLRRLRLPGPFL